jgi:hypothetical protein
LIEQARSLSLKENKALSKAKPLLTKLVGDNTWAPCGLMIAPDDRDALLFTDTVSFFNRPASRVPTEASAAPGAQENTATETAQRGTGRQAIEAQAAQSAGNAEQHPASNEKAPDRETLPDAHADTNGEREVGPERDGQVNGNPSRGEESSRGLGCR